MVGRNLLEHPEIGGFDVLTPRRKDLDLLNYESTESYIRENMPDIIIHAAGKVGGIQANMREPASFLVENFEMGKNLVLSSRRNGVKRLINLGSSCMYPCDARNPLKEEMILSGKLEPTNEGYALAKIGISRLCEYVTREEPDYSYKTLIPCNLYGKWDRFDPLYSHMVAATIKKVHQATLKCDTKVKIWGEGTHRREFMYAGDFADCLIEALRNFDSLPQTMNVGVGYDHTINEYYRIIAEVVGYDGEFVHDLSQPIGMKQKLLDIGRQKAWGWEAKTSLEKGLAKTYEFYLQQEQNGRS